MFFVKSRSRTVIFSVKGAQKWLMEQTNDDVYRKTDFGKRKFSIEILTEEFKPEALDAYKRQNRQHNNFNWTLSRCRLIEIPS